MRVVIGLVLVLLAIAMTVTLAAEGANEDSGREPVITNGVIQRALNYQARLKDNAGNPVPDDSYNMTFRIYRQSSGGSSIWNSGVLPVETYGGLFSVELGPLDLPFDTTYFLSIQIAPDPEMTQRQKMTMAAYAAVADTANFAFNTTGGDNWVLQDGVLYTNGTPGLAKGDPLNCLHGQNAWTMVNIGLQCTTGTSGMDNVFSTVGGGFKNVAAADYNTVAGGDQNHANANYSFVGGGHQNQALDLFSTIAGGHINTAGGYISSVCGGSTNSAGGTISFVGGGELNSANGPWSSIVGGWNNQTSDTNATIGGGRNNVASGFGSVIGGGGENLASGYASTISGGGGGVASGFHSTVGGGAHDTASASFCTVSGGYINAASGDLATVGGGEGNKASGYASTIGGGYTNTASGDYSAIGGGYNNHADGEDATVGGGYENSASAWIATVGGGRNNIANAQLATIGGGFFNSAYMEGCTVAGGIGNTASGMDATVGGGSTNTAEGTYSVIPGGYANSTSGAYTMVYGHGVHVELDNRVVFYNATYPGRLGINRDDESGGINYPIQVGTNSSNGNAAYLTNGGTWTSTSSRLTKENFTPFDGSELLAKISGLSVTTYNYINSSEKHVGPVAEEFVGAFDVGAIRESDGKRDDTALAASDVAGVALAGVQELLKKMEALEKENAEIKAEIARLQNNGR